MIMRGPAKPWEWWGGRRALLLPLLLAAAGALLLGLGEAEAQAFPPPAKTEQGADTRDLYLVVFTVAAVVFVVVEAALLVLVLKYRRKDDTLPPQIHGNNAVEVLWTAIPTVIVVAMFILSFLVLEDIESAPDEGEEVTTIDVLGQQWTWSFRYASPLEAALASAVSEDPAETVIEVTDGTPFRSRPPHNVIRLDLEHLRVTAISGNTLTVTRGVDGTVAQPHASGTGIDRIFLGTESAPETRLAGAPTTPVVTVPVGRTVRFNLAAQDVIHSFYTPQFLYKLDAVPGRVQSLWINVTEAGLYQGQCAEFCGANHARMIFSVRALAEDDFDTWLAAKTPDPGEPEPPGGAAPGGSTPTDDATADLPGDPVRGQELFFANGCNACHGDTGQGGIGPKIAATTLTLAQEMQQYRNPRQLMPRFDESKVPDADVADIYSWLQTLE